MGLLKIIALIVIFAMAFSIIVFTGPVSVKLKWSMDCLEEISREVCDNKGGEFNGLLGPAGFSCIVEHEPKAFVFTTPELNLCKK